MGDVTDFLKKAENVVDKAYHKPLKYLPGISAAASGLGVGGDLGALANGALNGGGGFSGWTDTGIAGLGGAAASGLGDVGNILQGLGGDVGDFFKTDIGKAVTTFFKNAGGNIGKVGTLLDQLGITDQKKDMVEDMLTVAALTALGQITAKDAIDTAKQYESQQKALTESLVADAAKFSDPKYIEANVQKAQADVNKQYGNARQATMQDLYARGLGDRMPGQVGAETADQAAALSGTRQNIELNAPLQAMTATNMALGPVATAAKNARTRADEQAQLPVNTWLALKAANASSPLDDYYRAQLAAMNAAKNPPATTTPTTTTTLPTGGWTPTPTSTDPNNPNETVGDFPTGDDTYGLARTAAATGGANTYAPNNTLAKLIKKYAPYQNA